MQNDEKGKDLTVISLYMYRKILITRNGKSMITLTSDYHKYSTRTSNDYHRVCLNGGSTEKDPYIKEFILLTNYQRISNIMKGLYLK